MTLCWQAKDGDPDLTSFDKENYAVNKDEKAFCPLEDYAYNIQKSLQGQFDEEFRVDIRNRQDVELTTFSPGGDGVDPIFMYEFNSGRFSTVGPQSTRNLSQRMESIAVSLTNWGLQTTNDTVRGEAFAEESYVRVRWQWIALPVFLELASLPLLVLTIIHSRREGVPLWKSSALALIYHRVDELRGEESLATERLSGMEITAKTVDVQLVKSEDGVNSLSKRSGYRAVDQDE
jgi:hypothetical protein